MEGLHIFARFNPARGLDDQAGLEGCIPSSPNSQREPNLLQSKWEQKTYQFVCLPFGLTSAPWVFTKIMRPMVGKLRQMGIRLIIYLDDILIMHHSREEMVQITPLVCQVFEALGLMVNMGKSQLIPQQELEFLGFLVNSVSQHLAFPTEKMRKIQQNARTLLQQQQVSIRDIARFVGKASASMKAIWQAPLHYRALQFMMNLVAPLDHPLMTRMTKFSVRLNLTEEAKTDLFPGSTLHDGVLPITSSPRYDYSVSGQPVSCDLYKQNGRDPLSGLVQPGNITVELEPAVKHIPACRVPSWEGEQSGRSGIEGIEGQMRLDAKSPCFQSDPIPDGPMRDRSLCIASNKTASKVFQLETGPRSRGHRCLQPELGDGKVLCQSSMVPHSSVPITGEKTDGKDGDNHPTVELPAMVSNYPGSTGKFSSPSPSEDRPGSPANNARICHEAGSSGASCMAHLRGSFTSQGISSAASELLLSSWRTKTKSNYNSLFTKWANWGQQRDRDPTTGPIKDIINFLAELYQDGYQYRSLNSYRSAISAVHSRVDDHPVGQHPLVSRMLKGVFNERPPLSRYSTFWDVGMVLRYLKQLESNDSLTLRLLTIKSVMLLALTRPSRSMDLSKLDIQHRTYTSAGLVFKAQHLSKQSRPSKSLSDFYYPRFSDDTDVCPVATIQAYEQRTIQFRTPMSVTGKTSLFLSWIEKHEPVTSSTIARWLKTCLQEAGIDTGVFKAHSVRGAASSKAAWSGVTISDILQAADWSSEQPFKGFIIAQLMIKKILI